MSVRYRVVHRTHYRYSSEVSSSYGVLHLLPRDLDRQRVLSAAVALDPVPGDAREHRDFFGNRVSHVTIHEPHTALTVTATSVVEVAEDGGVPLFGQQAWEEVRDGARADLDTLQFVLDSPRVGAAPAFAEYAAPSFPPGAAISEAVLDLSARIHRDFAFVAGSTGVDTPVADVLAGRRGVCQDFAHVGIACLRSLGLPARYVSGYLETDPPPGREKLVGADVSHAWFSVPVPGAGWLDVDPTNDVVVGPRHIVTAYGRDYGDVAPVQGVIYTRGQTDGLEVTVDVTAL